MSIDLGRLHLWWHWRLTFEPRDCWVGLYWKRYPQALDLYLCGLPMLPLNLYFQWDWSSPGRIDDLSAPLLDRGDQRSGPSGSLSGRGQGGSPGG